MADTGVTSVAPSASARSMNAAMGVRMPLLARYASSPYVGAKASMGVGTGENVLVSWFNRAIKNFLGVLISNSPIQT